MKVPNIKLQTPEKFKTPSSNVAEGQSGIMEFGIWSFSDVWCLEVGTF
jgi:hypothetical protein